MRYNGFARGKFTNKQTGEVTRTRSLSNPGWAHTDNARRDHPATPGEGRTPEGDMARQGAQEDQAMSKVKGGLQKQFDHLHAEQMVNDLFNDRRS